MGGGGAQHLLCMLNKPKKASAHARPKPTNLLITMYAELSQKFCLLKKKNFVF